MSGRRIAILGAGGIGRGLAALLLERGEVPVLWSPRSGASAALAAGAPLRASGRLEGAFHPQVARSCAEAVQDAAAVILALPGNGYQVVLKGLACCIGPSQPVIISAHLSLAALHFSKLLAQRGAAAPPIIAWSTTVLTARPTAPNAVHVSGLRAQVDMAVLPARRGAEGLALCEELFGPRFRLREDVLAIQLSNLNPPAHMANMMFNLTRAERGEEWENYGGITPAVARLVEALDRERLALAAAFGLRVRTVEEHYILSFGTTPGPLAAMAAEVAARRRDLAGPKTLDTRFVTEDVPFGLVPLEVLGRIAGVAMPLHGAGIALLSAAYGRDFRAENGLLPALALEGRNAAAVHELCRQGWPLHGAAQA